MKILVIGPSWVGDMMMSQSLYQCLKQEYPEAAIDVMAPAWCKPLLARMPQVHQSMIMPLGHGRFALAERYRLGKSLRSNGYVHAYVLPNSFKSALVPFFADIPHRTGWHGEMRFGVLNDRRKLDKSAFPLMVERYASLAYERTRVRSAADLPKPFPRPALQVGALEMETICRQFQIEGPRPVMVFCPGAEFGPAKRWPHYHYASLAQQLIDVGWQIVLLGSDNDRDAAAGILAALRSDQRTYCRDLAGKTSLDQAVVLIGACRAVVSNDSGLMHVAAALDKPLVALYGPTSPDFTPPLSAQARVIRLISGYKKLRKGNHQFGYHHSMVDIQPAMVFTALQQLIGTGKELSCMY